VTAAHATLHRRAALGRPAWIVVAARPIALVVALAGLLCGAVWYSERAPTSLAGRSSAMWMSAESIGRVVLVAPRSTRPTVAVDLGETAAQYDMASVDGSLVVHNRVTGSVIRLDTASGKLIDRGPGPVPTDAQPTLIGANDAAYLFDRSEMTVQRIDATGTRGAVVRLPEGYSTFAGGAGGLLWLLDGTTGNFATFDGTTVSPRRLSTADGDVVWARLGREPAVYDVTSHRVRWLRLDESVEVPGTPAAGQPDALVEWPAAVGDQTCLTVIRGTTMSCIDAQGVVRRVELSEAIDLNGARLHASDDAVVVTRAGSTVVELITWDGAVKTFERREPSGRPTEAGSSSGSLLVDDPGSPYAFSVDGTDVLEIEKLSKRTIVVNVDSTADGGVGEVDANADVAGVLPSNEQITESLDDGQNDPPIAQPDHVTTRAGRAVDVPVLANDADPEGDPLWVSGVADLPADQGAVVILRGSRLDYQPTDAPGDRQVVFDYRVADIGGLEGASTVTVDIVGTDRNTSPVTVDDEVSTHVNMRVEVPVTVNDTDAEGDPINIVAVGTPQHGSTSIAGASTIRYEPATGYVGTDQFTYSVVDGYGGSAEGTVRVEVQPASTGNNPPIANDDRAATTQGTRVFVEPLLNDTDPDGDTLRVVGVTPLAGLTTTILGQRSIEVVPDPSVAGLVVFDYTVSDGSGLQDTARIALFVQQTETTAAPVAVDDSVTSAAIDVSVPVTANDLDPNGGQLVVDAWTQPSDGGGSAVRESPTNIRFTPTPGFRGTTRFEYTVKNVAGRTDTGIVTVQVTDPTGSGPVAQDDRVTAIVGDPIRIDALANDRHPDSLPFDYSGPPVTRSGTATIGADRWITFVPPTDQPDLYIVTYQIQDSLGRTSAATITISVIARPVENRPPRAFNDLASTDVNTPVTIDVLGNDDDPDNDSLSIDRVGKPTSGSASITGGRIRFTPAQDVTGLSAFTYDVIDEKGAVATATVTVVVNNAPPATPITVADLVNLPAGTSTTIDPVANDIDPDGTAGALTLGSVSSTPGLTVQVTGRNVRITSNGTAGRFQLTYAITDPDGLGATGTIDVVVDAPLNSSPVANDDAATANGQTITIPVLDNDTDPDGGVLTLVSVDSPSPPGSGGIAANGNQVIFSPGKSFTGVATFSYVVRDAQNATARGTVRVSVASCPALPTVAATSVFTKFQTAVSIPLFGGAVPPESVTITAGDPSAGTATLSASRTDIVYTPPSTFKGDATVPYTLRSSCGETARGTITVTVNRSPLAVNDSARVTRGGTVTIDVLGNDSDPDGDTLRVQSVTAGTGGTPSLSGQVVSFTADNSPATTTGSFTYVAVDPAGSTSTARVTLTFVNGVPVANPDSATFESVAAAGSVVVPVIPNDSDLDGDPLTLAAIASTSPSSAGVAKVRPGGVEFKLNSTSFRGTVTIGYVVSDGTDTAAGVLTITITNAKPIAVSNSLTINAGDEPLVNVLANDSDPDGTPGSLIIVGVSNVSGGTVTIESNQLRVVPNTGATSVQATYRIRDADGDEASGTLTVTVSAPPTTTTSPPTTTTTTTTTIPPTTTTEPPTTTTTVPAPP
jgi:hypothetical protein